MTRENLIADWSIFTSVFCSTLQELVLVFVLSLNSSVALVGVIECLVVPHLGILSGWMVDPLDHLDELYPPMDSVLQWELETKLKPPPPLPLCWSAWMDRLARTIGGTQASCFCSEAAPTY